MPWRTIYVREHLMDDQILIHHELIHIEQIERDGPIRFSARYLIYLLKYGYLLNPYEIEAYSRSDAFGYTRMLEHYGLPIPDEIVEYACQSVTGRAHR